MDDTLVSRVENAIQRLVTHEAECSLSLAVVLCDIGITHVKQGAHKVRLADRIAAVGSNVVAIHAAEVRSEVNSDFQTAQKVEWNGLIH